MSVYVDDVRLQFGRMIMCHMWADTDAELLAMADVIGVQRKWIQGHSKLSFGKHLRAGWVHFDISIGAKSKAIAAGAILTDKYGPTVHVCKLRIDDPRLGDLLKDRAREQLAIVGRLRNRNVDRSDLFDWRSL
jgi:hypothetical protein